MMKNAQKVLVVGLLLSLVGLLAGCGERKIQVGWVASSAPGRFSASYASFTGSETRTVRADAGEMLVLRYEIEVNRGTLSVRVEDPDGEILWDASFEEAAVDSVQIPAEQDGRYAITVQGDGAGGSFELLWEL